MIWMGSEGVRKKKRTFSKQAVKWILIVCMADLQLSYLLAFLGKEQIAETLSITVVTSVIAVMLGYFTKSFRETKEEEKVRLLEDRRQQEDRQAFIDNLRGENNNDVVG